VFTEERKSGATSGGVGNCADNSAMEEATLLRYSIGKRKFDYTITLSESRDGGSKFVHEALVGENCMSRSYTIFGQNGGGFTMTSFQSIQKRWVGPALRKKRDITGAIRSGKTCWR
jgi:hypothetical protein